MKYLKIIIFFSFIFLFVHLANAQSSIKANVDKNRVLLGEVFTLTLEVHLSPGSSEKFRPLDTIPHFEFASSPKIDTSDSGSGKLIRAVYQLSSFDSGRWSIPAISISSKLKTDSIPIDVMFSEFDVTQPYHDIKDIIETATPNKKFQWWWIVAGFVLTGAIVYYYFTRRKTQLVPSKPQYTGDPYQEAINKLDALLKAGFSPKQFHSGITDILRNYISRRKGIRSLQKTTADLVLQLKELDPDKERFEKLSQALRLADFVKFAKYEPSHADDKEVWTRVKEFITGIEQKEKNLVPAKTL